MDATNIKAKLLFSALTAAIDAGLDITEVRTILTAIETLQVPIWRFAALLRLAESMPSEVPFAVIQSARGATRGNADMDLAYAWFLAMHGHSAEGADVVSCLSHIRFEPYAENHSWGFSDVTYTVMLQALQELLGIPEGALPGVDDDHEASARAEGAARRLGHLRAMQYRGATFVNLDVTFRSLLLFHNQSVHFPTVSPRHHSFIEASRNEIYAEVAGLAQALGADATRVLHEVFSELASGPAGDQFTAHHRRYFAKSFYRQGVISREQAIDMGLSSTADTADDDPRQRQKACLEIATFLHTVGRQADSQNWMKRASEVSAGTASEKDYHMAQMAKCLTKSVDREEPATLVILDRLARALEVAGGYGRSDGAAEELELLLRLNPARASRLAVEWIDRDVLNLSSVLEALIVGGAGAGAGQDVLTAMFRELYSLITPDDVSAAALAVLRACRPERKREVAVQLMSSVRTNTLPGERVEVARALQDALREQGLGEVSLARGLRTGSDDSSRKSSLYRLKTGETETISRVAARLSDSEHPEAWNPNPSENAEFDWWSAIEKSRIKDPVHLDSLVAVFAPPDYREVAFLARKAECALEVGDWDTARKLIEQAIRRSEGRSWHLWFDGALTKTVFRVLKRIDRAEGIARARAQFSNDLTLGRLHSNYLLSDIEDIFELLEIDWPSQSVRAAVSDYLEQVLTANSPVSPYPSLNEPVPSWSVEQALCQFIANLVACPVVDLGVAARRVLAQYFAAGGSGLVQLISDQAPSVELEHILSAVHVGSTSNRVGAGQLRDWIEGVNVLESLAVRSIARRVSEELGWPWVEIRTRPTQPVILLPRIDDQNHDSDMVVGGDAATAWKLHQRIFSFLERAGLDARELRSEFDRAYFEIKKDYQWADHDRLQRWLRLALARFWLQPLAIVGRESAMRVFGRHSLSGRAPRGAEKAYDCIYPIYDPHLELLQPSERPLELRAMDWRSIPGDDERLWLSGAHADSWSDYPESAEGLHIIGERTWLIRPEWNWPREERHRGVVTGPLDSAVQRGVLESRHELTYAAYLDGLGQDSQQLIVVNSERQLAGPGISVGGHQFPICADAWLEPVR